MTRGRLIRTIAAATVMAPLLLSVLHTHHDPTAALEVRGIDVSHHQPPLDWPKLAQSIDFVFVKTTEGGDWRDTMSDRHWQGAGDAGLLRGAYHFFTLCRSGADQAANFLSAVPTDAELPAAIDLEFAGNCAYRPERSDLLTELRTFIDGVVSATGSRPIAYTVPDFYEQYLRDADLDVHWWIRSPLAEPSDDPPWTFWQALPRRLPGTPEPVDVNAFRGTIDELRRLRER